MPLPLFPLYPNATNLKYNVSFGIPGPKLYNIPNIGEMAKELQYPNSDSSILFPDIKYLEKFAQYDMGVAESIFSSEKLKNVSTIKDKNGKGKPILDSFNGTYDNATQEGMGLRSIEKSTFASIFESQKPYFEIAQIIIQNVSRIEDITARIAPLIGASINPSSALAIKSRKPKGNGPSGENALTQFGTPVAISFKGNGIEQKVKDFQNISSKGNKVKINKDGSANIESNKPQSVNDKFSDSDKFIYATISTVYSTGKFDPNVKYIYRYIDIDSEENFGTNGDFSLPEIDDNLKNLPESIIFGIFDSSGVPINPQDKLKYWGVNPNTNDFEKQDSIFEKAPWIKESSKWIFGSSVEDPNGYIWPSMFEELFHWKRYGDVVVQSQSPGDDWYRLKYGDVESYDSDEMKPFEFRKDDFIVTFSESSINYWREYYDFLSERSLNNGNIDPEDRQSVKEEISKLYTNDKILLQLQSMSKFGNLKSTFYKGVDAIDWTKYNSSDVPLDNFPDIIRRNFRPMKFNINGETRWIDPETQYDFKIIRVDSSNLIEGYKDSFSEKTAGGLSKNVEIKSFIKNKLTIKVSEGIIEKNFSLDLLKNDAEVPESYVNITEFNLTNWNIEFDESFNLINKKNDYKFKLFFDSKSAPQEFSNYLNTSPKSTFNSREDFHPEWDLIYSQLIDTESAFSIKKDNNGDYTYSKISYNYYYDLIVNPVVKAEADELKRIADEALQNGQLVVFSTFIAGYEAKLLQSKETHKRYAQEIDLLFTGEKSIFSNGRVYKMEIKNGKIIKWIFSEFEMNDDENESLRPDPFMETTLTIDITKSDIYGFNNIEKTTIDKFQASLNITGNKTIDSRSIQNNKLIINGPYSSGRYGTGTPELSVRDSVGNISIEPENPMYVGYLKRSQLTELDLENYYIVEGVRRDISASKPSNSANGSGSSESESGFYRMADALGIVPSVMDLVTSIFGKLVPSIKSLINLIKNPASFVTEIIKMKVQDNFTILNPEVSNIISGFFSESISIKNLSNKNEKKKRISDLRKKIYESEMKTYIHIDDDSNFKFLIDGSALIGFFGLLFGIKLDISNSFKGSPPIKPIFENSDKGNIEIFLKNFTNKDTSNSKDIESQGIEKLDLSKETKLNNTVEINGKYYEDISISYSTGSFKKDVNYKFIYVTEYVEGLILEGDKLSSDDIGIGFNNDIQDSDLFSNLEKASSKYEEAYKATDDDNKSLKKLILNKIKGIKSKINLLSQPMFKFLLGIVTLPLKIVFSIIKWILDFFKKLTNPIKFPDLMKEFLSFDWILKFFTPKGMFEMAGIKFNPDKLAEWCAKSHLKVNGKYAIPDDTPLVDLSEFLSVGFESQLPTYTAKQYRDLCFRPLRLLTPLFCLIEKIINAIIMLFWSCMGITAVIPPPLIKICKNINEKSINISDASEINSLLSSIVYNANISDVNNIFNANGNDIEDEFIYEIKLQDGRVIRDLDRDAVQKFMESNKDTDFNFSNFETL